MILIKKVLADIFEAVGKFIIPPFCAYCRVFLQEREVFCDRCLALIKPVVSLPLRVSKAKEISVFAIGDYEYPLKTLVHAKQYGNRAASRQLGHLLWQHAPLKYVTFDIIVPIPLYWTRYAWRWFNQSEEIAEVLSQYSGKPVVHLLKRNKKTVAQAGLSRQERASNLQDAFSLGPDVAQYKNKKILFVDDVMTTGATLLAAHKAVRSLKPSGCIAAVGCRVLNK